MHTVGIIAEYNPFHNGHRYQIEQIRKQTSAQNIVIVMSGDYVQRGTPAWTDKYLRTQMALSCGADMIFELPVCFSCASAEHFALAGVSILTLLGFVDGICFGCESGDITLLQKIASFLAKPPKDFEQKIASLTTQGYSYPAARQMALQSFFPEECNKDHTLLSSPNNILAIEYLKALTLLDSPLTPIAIRRNDNGYHANKLTGFYSSASSIRKECHVKPQNFLSAIQGTVPFSVHNLLLENADRYPVTEDDFSTLLYYRLCQLSQKDLAISDMTEEIFNRIQNQLTQYTTFSDFILHIKTKQYTYSRISRVLLHCLLNMEQTDISKDRPSALYARLLGFSKEKSSLLRQKSGIPIITKPADGVTQIQSFYHDNPALSQYAVKMYKQDLFASDLYRQIQIAKHHCDRPLEYHCHPIVQDAHKPH
mgnify:CR=1 FL=1